MLTPINWSVRVAACVLIGVYVFTSGPVGGGVLALEIVVYVLGLAVIGYPMITDLRGSTPPGPAFVIGYALVAAGTAAASCAEHGGGLIGLAIIVTLIAGVGPDPVAGWIVAGCAILGLELGAVIWSAGSTVSLGDAAVLVVTFIGARNRRSYRVQAEQSAVLVAQQEQLLTQQEQLLARQEELRGEQRRVAVLDERTRIAREIHDVLAHSLGALGIQIQTVRAVLTDQGDVDRALALLEQAQRMATDGLTETRRAVHALRGDGTRVDQQLVALVEAHRARYRSAVDLRIDGTPVTLTPEATVALIRVAQESLVNAAKHAPGQPVTARLDYGERDVRLIVRNALSSGAAPLGDAPSLNHVPFTEAAPSLNDVPVTGDAPSIDNETANDNRTMSNVGTANGRVVIGSMDGGYGLTGMRERLLLIGGTLDVGVLLAGGSEAGPKQVNSASEATDAQAEKWWSVLARVPR